MQNDYCYSLLFSSFLNPIIYFNSCKYSYPYSFIQNDSLQLPIFTQFRSSFFSYAFYFYYIFPSTYSKLIALLNFLLISNNQILQIKREMKDKYYHNDYKKMMGLDETRTASEKLLDKAIGGFKVKSEVTQKIIEKKIKQQNSNLTHIDVFNKLAKNIENNKNAVKVLKPLNILRKCLNDSSFITHPQINTFNQWKVIVNLVIDTDDKLVGNYSENGLVIDCLVQIFSSILVCLNKLKRQKGQVKQEEDSVKKQANESKEDSNNSDILTQLIQICEIHLIYLKMFTDDSFAFNKLLSELKGKFIGYYQSKLKGQSNSIKPQLYKYLQALLIKLFNLPFAKYEWIKQSLSQFFKLFNISYKHLLNQNILNQYLKIYNQFINQKASRNPGQSVNIFGTGGKGGKVQTVQIVSNDALDKWTSRQ